MSALLWLEPNDTSVEVVEFPLGERFAEAGSDVLRSRERHNPLRAAPSANDVIAFRQKFSRFSDEQRQRLAHAIPAFDSQFGKSISRPQSLTHCERILTSIKLTARPSSTAQGPGISVAPDSRPTSPPDTP